MNINSGVVTGNLTRDPQVRFTAGGCAICEITIAVNNRYKDQNSGEWIDRPCFLDAKCFGKKAEWCGENLQKGQKVAICYSLDQERWKDKESGADRSKLVLKIESLDNFVPRS